MAVAHKIPMDKFLNRFPGLQAWVEQDVGWKLDELNSVLVDAEKCEVTIDRNTGEQYETVEQKFVINGREWSKVDGNRER